MQKYTKFFTALALAVGFSLSCAAITINVTNSREDARAMEYQFNSMGKWETLTGPVDKIDMPKWARTVIIKSGSSKIEIPNSDRFEGLSVQLSEQDSANVWVIS